MSHLGALLLAGTSVGAASGQAAANGGSGRSLGLFLGMAVLSLVPFLLLLMTSFVRISVVLSILKSAVGAPQVPPSSVVTGLALILTLFVMAPTGERMYLAAQPVLEPALAAELGSLAGAAALAAAVERAKEPLRAFLLKQTGARDKAIFHGLAARLRGSQTGSEVRDQDYLVLVPAFLTSELRKAFQMGVLLFIPFLVLDMIIASILLALGMHMLSPTAVSLPFKLLLFVLVDGWQLVVKGLIGSYV